MGFRIELTRAQVEPGTTFPWGAWPKSRKPAVRLGGLFPRFLLWCVVSLFSGFLSWLPLLLSRQFDGYLVAPLDRAAGAASLAACLVGAVLFCGRIARALKTTCPSEILVLVGFWFAALPAFFCSQILFAGERGVDWSWELVYGTLAIPLQTSLVAGYSDAVPELMVATFALVGAGLSRAFRSPGGVPTAA